MSSAYLDGVDRHQVFLLPERVEDYVGEEHPVRVIDAFIDQLVAEGKPEVMPALREMGEQGGRKGYHPATMAKLFVWGYLNRVRSTRRLESEAGRNLELIWLLGKLQPDHTSISRFRKANTKRIKNWLKEFNLVCARLNLFGGEELGVDGVFLKAVNSKSNNHTQKKIRLALERLDERISHYLAELEASEKDEGPTDGDGDGSGSLREKLNELQQARKEAAVLLDQAKTASSGQASTVDPESRLLRKKSAPGASVVGFLGEVAVDGKEHLIAATEVVEASNDFGQLSHMASAAEEVLPETKRKRHLLADGGYFKIEDLAKCEDQGWEVCVPPYPERKTRAGKYPHAAFRYDATTDSYVCPSGERLTGHAGYRSGGSLYHTYYNTSACRGCPLKEQCVTGAYRKLHRHEKEATVERLRERRESHPELFRRRAAIVEHPLGSMMFWNEGRNLLGKGIEMANAELGLSALAYNVKRAIKTVGVTALVKAMG